MKRHGEWTFSKNAMLCGDRGLIPRHSGVEETTGREKTRKKEQKESGGLAFSAQSATENAVVPGEAAARRQSKAKTNVELKAVLPLWCLDEE